MKVRINKNPRPPTRIRVLEVELGLSRINGIEPGPIVADDNEVASPTVKDRHAHGMGPRFL